MFASRLLFFVCFGKWKHMLKANRLRHVASNVIERVATTNVTFSKQLTLHRWLLHIAKKRHAKSRLKNLVSRALFYKAQLPFQHWRSVTKRKRRRVIPFGTIVLALTLLSTTAALRPTSPSILRPNTPSRTSPSTFQRTAPPSLVAENKPSTTGNVAAGVYSGLAVEARPCEAQERAHGPGKVG